MEIQYQTLIILETLTLTGIALTDTIQRLGLYYLQSRYYYASWERFINADNLLIQTNKLLGNNMYAYCYNNPINLCDPTGNISFGEIVKNIVNFVVAPLKPAATAAWNGVVKGLEKAGMQVSANLLQHATQKNPAPLYFGNDSLIVDKIKNSSEFKSEIAGLPNGRVNVVNKLITFNSNSDLARFSAFCNYKYNR